MCGNILQISGLRSTWTPSDDHFNYYLKIVIENSEGKRWRHKINLWNYGIYWQIQKEQDEKCPLVKNQPIESF